jgi:hypothetical protein
MRILVFGAVGNEPLKGLKRDRVYYENIGSREQVGKLYYLWHELDPDTSGRVDVQEFVAYVEKVKESNLGRVDVHDFVMYAEKRMKEERTFVVGEAVRVRHRDDDQWLSGTVTSLAPLKVLSDRMAVPGFFEFVEHVGKKDKHQSQHHETHADKTGGLAKWFSRGRLNDGMRQILMGKKTACTLEDLMRLVWPACAVNDVREMKKWCADMQTERDKVKAPRMLKEEDLQGLCSIFRQLQTCQVIGGPQLIHLDTLIDLQMISHAEADPYLRYWAKHEDPWLDKSEFCILMCPHGYRVDQYASIATRLDGRLVRFDARLGYWVEHDDHDDEDEDVLM